MDRFRDELHTEMPRQDDGSLGIEHMLLYIKVVLYHSVKGSYRIDMRRGATVVVMATTC
jgi:hypothetical protein